MRRLVVGTVCGGLLAAGALVAPGPARAAPPAGAERWALVVGISGYRPPTKPTVGGAGDAADFSAMLRNHGWPADHVMVLSEGAATAGAIRNGLRWLRDRSTPTSYSVFHFSGHVKQMPGDRDRDGEALDEFLWAADNQFIADRELADWMRALKGWAWVDISGCEAAGFNDGVAAPNRLFTASSQEHEKSYEMPPWGNSVYTGLFVDQAVGQRRADYNRDGRVSIPEAFRMAMEQAPRLTAGQSKGAQHPYAAGGDGAEWFLDPPPPAGPATGGRRVCAGPVCVQV